MKTLQSCFAVLLLALGAQASADGLVDPTRRAGMSRGPTPEARALRVEAVFSSAERRLAIVNGKVVRVGDQVSGVRIDEILDDGVRYVRNGKTHTVRLRPASMPVRQVAETGR